MYSSNIIVKLKNGTEVESYVVTLTMVYLKQLFEGDLAAFKDLVKACREPNFFLSDNTLKIIEHYNLCKDKLITSVVKDIVLSAVQGTYDKLSLDSPLANS